MTIKGLFVLLFLVIFSAFSISLLGKVGDSISYSIATKARVRQQVVSQRLAQQKKWDELRYQKEKALAPIKIEAKQKLIIIGSIALAVMVIAFSGSFSYYIAKISHIRVKREVLRSSLIPVDNHTRLYPLLTYEVRGKLRVYNPNTGELVKIDKPLEASPLLANNSSKIQLAGVISEADKPKLFEGKVINI